MNRLKLYCLNNPAEVFTVYSDIPSLMSFLNRTGRIKIFTVVAEKGNRSLIIHTDDPNEMLSRLNEFNKLP